MQFDNQKTRNVADTVAKILAGETVSEELKGQQHKIDKNKNNKIDAHDFKILRGEKPEVNKEEVEITEEDAYDKDRYAVRNGKAVKDNPAHVGSPNYKDQPHHVWASSAEEALKKKSMKEEAEQLDELKKETLKNYVSKAADSARTMPGYGTNAEKSKKTTRHAGISRATEKLAKEEVEELDEIKMADLPSRKIQGSGAYGSSKPQPHVIDTLKGPKEKELKDIESEKKKKKPFSEMVDSYKTDGLKSLKEMFIKEEPTNDEYKKELEDVKAKASGAKTNPDIAKGKVDAVKQEEVEQIEEREMTDAEMKKREEIVKSMKKGMAGFKERYGDRAKNVMYATATKQAMK